MRVLILGGLGFIGGRLSEFLSSFNYEVKIATRQDNIIKAGKKKIEVIFIDWNKIESLEKACNNIDIIIHAAGANSQDSVNFFEDVKFFSRVGTSNLIKAARKKAVKKIIYLSTAHVYSNPLLGQINEEKKPENNHPYAISHLIVENQILSPEVKKDIDTVVLRLANSFGAPSRIDADCWYIFINDICKQAIINKNINIKSNVNTVRNFISLTTVLNFIKFILEVDKDFKNLPDIINIGERFSLSIKEVMSIVKSRIEKILNFTPQFLLRSFNEKLTTKEFLDFQTNVLKSTKFNNYYPIETEIDKLIIYCNENFKK